jgi:putative ABC transport system permease protein
VAGKPVPENARVHDVGDVAVSSVYFELFDIPIRLGRTFNSHNLPQTDHVAVVNKAFAHEYFSKQSPIGQKIRIGDEREWVTVVGVVGNEKRSTVYEEMRWVTQPAVYRPMAQHPPDYFAIAVQSATKQSGIGHIMEAAVASVDGQAGLGDIQSMQSRLEPDLKYPRFRAIVLVAFSCLAVMLAAVGLYGVLSQFVSQHTSDIGVRIALGAQGGDLAGLIVRVGGAPAFAGLFIGLTASFALTRYLSSLLYGVEPTDPTTFGAAVIVMIMASVVAMVLPMRRALRVDPMTVLRSE